MPFFLSWGLINEALIVQGAEKDYHQDGKEGGRDE